MGEKTPEAPPPAEELLAIRGFWRRDSVIILVDDPKSKAYIGSISWTQWDLKKGEYLNLGGRHARGFQKELGRGG